MEDLTLEATKGVNTVDAETRLPAGHIVKAENWVLTKDDRSSIHKMPGRTLAGSAPAASAKGIVHLQHDGTADQLVVLASSKLHEADAATTLGSWTEAKDQETPTALAVTGDYLKALPDTRNGAILWSGAADERPLVRSEDGVYRYLSMKKPEAPTLEVGAAAAYTKSPLAPNGAGTEDITASNQWNNEDKGRDGTALLDTFADVTLNAAGSKVNYWKFATQAATPDNQEGIYLMVGTSSRTPSRYDATNIRTGWGPRATGRPAGPSGDPEPLIARLKVEVAEDWDGMVAGLATATYVTLLEKQVPVENTTLYHEFVDNSLDDLMDIIVKVTLIYTSGTAQVQGRVYNITASDGALATATATGTYTYAVTEVYREVMAGGRIIEVESSPSDPVSLAIDGDNGIKLTPPARVNLTTDGYATANMFRRIYRSTSTGTWPDLGMIAEIDIDTVIFYDNFLTVTETTLGAPGIHVVTIGSATIHAAGQCPDFYDATLFQGAVVAIPVIDRSQIHWSMPGMPDVWPFPAHAFAPLPSERNDQLCGIAEVGDVLLVLSRTQILRFRSLPMADRADFDLGNLRRDILSPNEGLAGTPKAYCTFQSQKGHPMLAWVSDNGIWATDGNLITERGLGVIKLSVNVSWETEVDTSRLDETNLTFDADSQIIWFDYYDTDGNRRCITFHTSSNHWIPTGQDQLAPMYMGPHPCRLTDRAIGELSGELKQWSLNATDSKVYNERTGSDDDGDDIVSYLEWGWTHAAGPMEQVHFYKGIVYHGDWGTSEFLDLEIQTRRDGAGTPQTVHKRGLSLRGDSSVPIGLINMSGQSLKVRAKHIGKTANTGRSLGPVMLRGAKMGEYEGA
jgi:hypothetical protein